MPARLQSSESNRTVLLDKPIMFVGRHPDCDLVITHSRKVSRKHCCLAEINGQFVVRDLGSTNGVQINGRRVTGTRELHSGDELIIGDCAYQFLDGQIIPEDQPVARPGQANHAAEQKEPVTPLHAPQIKRDSPLESELSSEIPLMLDEDDADGFEAFPGDRPQFRPNLRRRANSDSHMELAID